MRRNGRRIDFVGLTNTLLTDSDVLYLVGVLESLPRPPADSQMCPSPKLEIKQTTLSAPVRERLMAAGKYAGRGASMFVSAPPADQLLASNQGRQPKARAHRRSVGRSERTT